MNAIAAHRMMHLKKILAAPSLVLAMSLALTVVATQFAVRTTNATDRARFQSAVQSSEDRISARMNTYVALLRATSGLFAARESKDEQVDRGEFHAYVERLNLAHSYPGIQGIGFSQRVPRADKDAFVAATRAAGAHGFHIWPEQERLEYHPALFLEPVDPRNRAMLGYDMYSDPARREAMERARDTGLPALSGKIALLQETEGYRQPGFLLYVPIYRERSIPGTLAERRAALRGFAYGAFGASDLFKGIFPERNPRVVFEVYDRDAVESQSPVYDSQTIADRARVPPFTVTRRIDVGGRRWTVVMAPTASFEREAHGPAIPLTAATGIVLSLAFFIAARAQANARAAAERAADEIRRSMAKRVRAEEALRQSSRRVQVIIDALPALISFVDAEERYRFVSRGYQEWFGLSSEQIVGKKLGEILGERVVKELRPYMEQVMAGEHVTFEATIPHRSGGSRIVHGSYAPHFSESGRVEGFIALITDVTQQKRSEDWQRFLANATGVLASSMDYETTLQSVAQLSVPRIADHCVVYMADAVGTLRRLAVAHVDPAKLELLGEIQRRFPLDRNAPIGPVQVLRTGVSELIPYLSESSLDAFTSDPEYRAAVAELNVRSAMSVPLRIRDEIMGVMTFTLSEPGRAYTDEDLQRAEDLARRAAAAIENARLYSAAQDAIRIRDEFLSIASHELKTPLTPLQLQLDSLGATLRNSELKSDKLNRRLETANRQTRRLAKLVENLLDVSRISAGRLSLERERFDLSAVTAEVAERFGPDAAAAGCRVTVHADRAVLGDWDRLRLEQVVTNLLSNAIKYGAGKPIDIHVRQDGGTARLTVADQGIGISPEDSARIFGRFERAVPLRHYGGMGLGLYIARQIVDAHGGSIVVSSAPGRGSTFTVVLPLSAASLDAQHASEALGSKTLQ